MTINVQIDVHVFTAGSGGAGKTTALLNALSYFVQKRDDITSIFVFDEGDNPDFASMWMPNLRVQDLSEKTFGHTHVQLNMIDSSPIYAFEPKPAAYRGFRWNSLNKIITSYVGLLGSTKKTRVVVLVDTGGSPGSIFRNAGNLSTLNQNYNWKIYPWILWTPNSLINSNFLELTKLSVRELMEDSIKHSISSNQSIHVFHVFNPILPDSASRSALSVNRLADLIVPRSNRITLIETFLAYQARNKRNEISIDDFIALAKFAFVEAKSIDVSLPPMDVYKVIGKALNFRFIDKNTEDDNKFYGYSNIFCNGFYDRDIAAAKFSPGLLSNLLSSLREESFEEGDVAPVQNLYKIFGEIYRSYKANLDKYFSLQ